MWETWKNICAVVVLAFIIATHPHWVVNIANFCVRVIYNGSVLIVGVVEAGAKKASETDINEFQKPVPATPDKPFNPKAKEFNFNSEKTYPITSSEYQKFLAEEKEKLYPKE